MHGALWIGLILVTTAWSQTLEIVSEQGDRSTIEVGIDGEVLLSICADLAGAGTVSGFVFHLALPAGAFALEMPGPFRPGALFADASEFANGPVPSGPAWGTAADIEVLTYAAVVGPAVERGRTGRGELARLVLRPLRAVNASIHFVQSPVYPANVVLGDGRGERVFRSTQGIDVHVRPALLSKEALARPSWARIKSALATREKD